MKQLVWILAAREEEQSFTREKAAKKRARVWMIVVGIIWLVLYNCLLIKFPFYIYMNLLKLPEECTSLETNVIITDLAYGWHVEAERLIYSSQGEEAIEDYIYENNHFAEGISANNFYELNGNMDYDHDILIPSGKYPYQEQDAENYILLHYTSSILFGEWDLYTIMYCLGIVIMFVLCRITYRINLHWHKNKEIRKC